MPIPQPQGLLFPASPHTVQAEVLTWNTLQHHRVLQGQGLGQQTEAGIGEKD